MKNLLALTSILLPLQACWFTTASTDVDNEITVSVLGQVTNGQALAKTLVVIQNQSGQNHLRISIEILANQTWVNQGC